MKPNLHEIGRGLESALVREESISLSLYLFRGAERSRLRGGEQCIIWHRSPDEVAERAGDLPVCQHVGTLASGCPELRAIQEVRGLQHARQNPSKTLEEPVIASDVCPQLEVHRELIGRERSAERAGAEIVDGLARCVT